jgi:NADH dehydrogenase
MRRLALLPVLPISGEGEPVYEPIWADDVARSVVADLAAGDGGTRRLELAGPERLTYDQIARLIARAAGRERPLVHVPTGLVQLGLTGLRRALGEAVFATWEEAELMEVPMVSERGTADAESLGVEPRRMGDVLGA